MKRIISLLLAIIMLVCLIPADLAYAKEGGEEEKLDVVLLNDGQYMIKLPGEDYTSVMQTLAKVDYTIARQAPVKPNINPEDNSDEFTTRTVKVRITPLVVSAVNLKKLTIIVTCGNANYSREYELNVQDADTGIKVPVPKAKHFPQINVRFDDGRDARYVVEAKTKPTNVVQIDIDFLGHTGVATRWYGTADRPDVKANYVAINASDHIFDLPKVDQNSILRRGNNPWSWKGHNNIVNLQIVSEDDIRCDDEKTARTINLLVDNKKQGQLASSNYYFHITGDALHGFTATMREKNTVGFDAGDGKWKTQKPAQQFAANGLKLSETFMDAPDTIGPVTVPNGANDLTPPTAEAGKPAKKFAGWSTTKNGLAVDMATYVVTGDVTFYALYAEEEQGKVKVEYKDSKTNAAIDSKYQLKGQEYPAEKKGDMGKAIKDEVFDTNKAPKFLGYKIKSITTDPVPNPPATANYTKNGDYTVIYTYDKLDDIIPEKKNGQDNPDVTPDVIEHYAKVTFQVAAADGAKAKLQLDGADATSPLVYYVNPLEGKTIAQVANVKAISKDDNLYKVDANDMWTYDPDTITSTGQVISQATDGEGNVVKTEITLTAKVAEKTAAKFKGKLEPQDIKVWVGDSIDWKTGVKLTDNSLKTEFNEAKFNDINNLTGAKLFKQADDTFKLVKSDGTTEVQDNELRNSSTATGSPFVGKILVTFSDGSSLEVSNQKLYVADKIVPNTNNPIVPDNAIKVVFANGDGVAAIKHEGYLVKPGTTLESSGTNNKFPTPVLDATKANDYKEEFAWSPAQNTAIAKPSTSNNYYTVVPNGHDVFKFTVSATPKGQSTVTVKYVDKNGTQLNPSTDSKLQIEGEVYPSTLTGKEGKDITYKKGNTDLKITERQNAPKILGYKLLDDDASTADKDDAFEFTSDKYAAADATVTIKYEKIDDIIKPTTPNEEKPAGYVTVKFLADNQSTARGHFEDNKKEVEYYVNPKTVTINMTNQKLSGNDKKGTAMEKPFPTLTVTDNKVLAKTQNGIQQWNLSENTLTNDNKLSDTNTGITLRALYEGKPVVVPEDEQPKKPGTQDLDDEYVKIEFDKGAGNDLVGRTSYWVLKDSTIANIKAYEAVPAGKTAKEVVFKIPSASKDGYNWVGWTADKPAGNAVYDTKLSDYNAAINEDVKFTAEYEEKLVRPADPNHPIDIDTEVEVIFKKGEHGTLSGLAIVNNVEMPVSGRAELAYYVKKTATWEDMEDYKPKAIGDANWTFSNWNPILPEKTSLVKDGDKVFTAQYHEQDLYITLTLDENYRGGRVSDYDVYQNDLIEGYLYRPRRKGYVFEGWSYNSRRLDEVRPGDRICYSTILYAIWSKQKPKDDEDVEPVDTREVGEHKAYMFGYTDGTVRPNGYITRAEAAALVTRLLGLDTFASAAEPAFTDTPSSWYNKAINAAVQRGIMKGYPDKSFRPNAPITRAEFTQMISTIDNKPYGVAPFADVVGHWAERPIGSEYQAGRIKGYPDGTFRPNAFITRAEAVVILNKIFERNYDAMSAMNAKNKEYIKRFIDLAPSFWGFNDMVEATNTHLFKRRVKGAIQEDWTEVK